MELAQHTDPKVTLGRYAQVFQSAKQNMAEGMDAYWRASAGEAVGADVSALRGTAKE